VQKYYTTNTVKTNWILFTFSASFTVFH